MKLSNRNNAVYFLLDDCAIVFGAICINETTDFIKREFANMKPLFRKKIQYLCKPFVHAFDSQKDKLHSLLEKESFKQSGTMIVPIDASGHVTIFFDLDNQAAGKVDEKPIMNGCIIAFLSLNHIRVPELIFCHEFRDGGVFSFFAGDSVLQGGNQRSHYQHFIKLILFANYCEVETKIIKPGKRDYFKNEKYVNESPLAIEILDSTWFTTLVRSEGFSVGAETGGFFRWQRFGPGLSQKKIIWVAPFEKKGYTRRAGKLKYQDKIGPNQIKTAS
jgi:hypothetical protein